MRTRKTGGLARRFCIECVVAVENRASPPGHKTLGRARRLLLHSLSYDPATTDFTAIVVPSTSPVTFAFAPAKSFSFSSATLSEVSSA
jgi:hypothetical protein